MQFANNAVSVKPTSIKISNMEVTHAGFERASVYKSADQSIPSSTWTDISFDSENFDVGDTHDNSTNNARITVTTTGTFLILFQTEWTTTGGDDYKARIYKNGTTSLVESAMTTHSNSNIETVGTSIMVELTAGDYITLQGFHSDAAAKDIKKENTHLSVTQIFKT